MMSGLPTAVLHVLNIGLFVVHSGLIAFNLTGWIFPRVRILSLHRLALSDPPRAGLAGQLADLSSIDEPGIFRDPDEPFHFRCAGRWRSVADRDCYAVHLASQPRSGSSSSETMIDFV